jgi:L-alanine-DL-glutamate epimerase-like enolase superfamily enzyme
MEQIKKIKVKSINSKILFGDFGNGKYFGYKNKKIISLVEIKLSNKLSGFGESLVGIYSPDLYKKNLEYLSKFFINKNVYECLEVSKNLQKNKFFFYSGLLKSILASIEIAIFNLIAKLKKKTFAEALNDYFFLGKRVLLNDISVYASAGSIRSTLRDLEKDLSLSEKLKIKNIKIRLNIKSEYKKKITILKSKNFKFAVDLISNTFEDNEILKFPKFLSFIKNFNPLWIEEVLNVDKLWDFQKLKKKHNIKYSYGENFNSKFDFYNLIKLYKFDYINVDISHITITELVEMVILLEKNNFKNKILFHCWGGVINLQTSLELASLFKDQVYMTEFPIADFSLNNDFVHNVDIVDSKVNLNSINRMNINDIHAKDKNLITKNLINKYEFNFKK